MYGLLDLDGRPAADFGSLPPAGEPAPAPAYGATTVGAMPIEPSRADASGSKADGSVGGKSGRSHRIDVVAPGAIHVQVRQVNWPDLPQELPVVRIAEDRFQTRTRGAVPQPGGGSSRAMVALIFVRVAYPDGRVVYHPPLDRLITYEEIAKYPIRPGLQPGNRRPRWIGKTQVITLSAPTPGASGDPEVDSGVDVALTETPSAGPTTPGTTTPGAPAEGLNLWAIAGAAVGAGVVGWFVLRATGVPGPWAPGQRAPDPWAPNPWAPDPSWAP